MPAEPQSECECTSYVYSTSACKHAGLKNNVIKPLHFQGDIVTMW